MVELPHRAALLALPVSAVLPVVERLAWSVVELLHRAALLALPAVTVLQVPNGWRCRRSRSGTRSSREAATCRPAGISRVPSGGNSQRAR